MLVVEDEFLVRYAIVLFLRDCGCVVLDAQSAEQAVAMGRHYPVDVLLTDVNLSGPGSGWDVAQTLRVTKPAVGVIYVSGNSVDPSRLVSGSHFFSKPYDERVILEACRELAHTKH